MTADDPCPDCGGSTHWHGPARDWACSLCEKVCRHDSAPAFLAKHPPAAEALYFDNAPVAHIVARQEQQLRDKAARAARNHGFDWREKAPATPVLEMRHVG